MILVVGATAYFGRDTVEQLVAAGEDVRALTRDPGKAALPDGVEVVRGDLNEPDTLPPALDGVTAMFLVLPYPLRPDALIEAAKTAGVRRVVFLSSGAVVDGAAEQPNAIAAYHADVERVIADSGMEWTFLRIFFPAINTLSWAGQLQAGDVVRAPYGEAAGSAIHEADVAAVAVRALTADGHAGAIYDLTGPESLTQVEQVEILGRATGRPLSFEELEPEPVRQAMSQFMDPGMLNSLFDLMAASAGVPAAVNSTVEKITGRRPRTYTEWAADHAADFG
jgi:uncharacterized protein YbjT (DUF2867 family)